MNGSAGVRCQLFRTRQKFAAVRATTAKIAVSSLGSVAARRTSSRELEMDVQRAKDRECVDDILRAGRHLLGLINEVLDVTRADAGGLASSLEPVHLRTLLEEAFALAAPLAVEHGVTPPEELPEFTELLVRADRVRLRQVLLNLLSSAVKYNRGSERVTLACAISPSGRLRVDIRGPHEKMCDRILTGGPAGRGPNGGTEWWSVHRGTRLARQRPEAHGAFCISTTATRTSISSSESFMEPGAR